MFSTKCRYAIKAVVVLARAEQAGQEKGVRIRDLARTSHLPGAYLAKIVCELARAGVVTTAKGPGGGVRLARAAEKITLSDVVEAVDRVDGSRRCVLEFKPCSEVKFCPLHRTCKHIRERILKQSTFKNLCRAYDRCFPGAKQPPVTVKAM